MFEFVDNMMCFLYGSMACLGVFLITWVISVIIKNAGIIDIIWGLGFAIQALVFYLTSKFQENFVFSTLFKNFTQKTCHLSSK